MTMWVRACLIISWQLSLLQRHDTQVMTHDAQVAETGANVLMSVYIVFSLLRWLTVFSWVKKFCCVAARKSLILNLSLHFSEFFKTVELRFKMLVVGFISSIIITSMLFMSIIPFLAEKTFCSRMDSAMLAAYIISLFTWLKCYNIYRSWSFRPGLEKQCCSQVCREIVKAVHECRRGHQPAITFP